METRTFYSDETKYFRIPAEPDAFEDVKIILRTGRYQARSVFLCIRETAISMTWEYDRHNFDYYSVVVNAGDSLQEYYFRIDTGEQDVVYDKAGVVRGRRRVVPFKIIPGYKTPEWSKGCLYYQIFTDRFCRVGEYRAGSGPEMYMGRPVIHSDWKDPVSPETYRQLYGGNLQGIISKLPYLRSLGVEALYLNPVFVSPSSHKYDCSDYGHIDPSFGIPDDTEASDRLFAELVEKAHEAGIRVVIDGVFNHCSSDHRWFDKEGRNTDVPGAYGHPSSPYHDRFRFTNDECTGYEAWWNVPTLPKLNYEGDASLEQDILSIAEKWISPPYNADGWRLDVAADLGHSPEYNHEFWKKFRQRVKACKEDRLIMAEHYDKAEEWLSGGEWDSVMNYRGFMDPATFFFTGTDKHSDRTDMELKGNAPAFRKALIRESAAIPDSAAFSSLIQLDNHDHSRFLTRTAGRTGRMEKAEPGDAKRGIRKGILRQAAAFMYFWKGSPGLYYGDEAGVCGFTDPDNRRCYPWGDEDKDLLYYFKCLGQLRKAHSYIKDASTTILYTNNGIFSFARFTDNEFLITAVSAAGHPVKIMIPVWPVGLPGFEENREVWCVMSSWKDGYSFEEKPFIAHKGLLAADIEPEGALVFAGKL